MYTRDDYMNKKCTHREYYGQFVTEHIKNTVVRLIGMKKLMASKDEHLNDIPLTLWDNLPFHLSPELLKRTGDQRTLCVHVCVMKEAARQIIEENKGE